MPEQDPSVKPPALRVDEEAGVAYIQFSDKVVARTEGIGDLINVDYDKKGIPVGLELIGDVSQFIPKA